MIVYVFSYVVVISVCDYCKWAFTLDKLGELELRGKINDCKILKFFYNRDPSP